MNVGVISSEVAPFGGWSSGRWPGLRSGIGDRRRLPGRHLTDCCKTILAGRSPMKIAVIEDHTLIRDMLMVLCRQVVAGASVVGARDAVSGLAVCRSEKPDLVFLDLALPDRDGLDIVDDIFAACPSCKIIALSGYTDEFTLHRALRSNVHGFVDKNEQPLDVLQEAISTVMSGKRYFFLGGAARAGDAAKRSRGL